MNTIASALWALTTLLVVYALLLRVVHLPAFALTQVRINGPLTHVSAEEIETVVKSELTGNFFTLDLAHMRAAFDQLPWVRQVEVRRHWPDRLDVTFEEHAPLARWGDMALVDTHGEVFHAAYDGVLPLFIGPVGSAKEIAIQYAYFQRTLSAVNRQAVQVQITPRRSWQIKLDNGLIVALGREDIESRLSKFVAVYDQTIEPMQRRLDYVDLRYPNGFAVRLRELGGGGHNARSGKG